MKTAVISGVDAWRLLFDSHFVLSWNRLADSCPWATIFQRPAFVRIWYDCYREEYEPLILLGKDDDGTIVGLWFLATSPSDPKVVPAGAHQAEYHGWLSTMRDNHVFIDSALRALSAAVAIKRLTLTFLAPGIPLEWPRTGGAYSVRLRPNRRGLMKLDRERIADSSLRKKSNKSRLSRLRRKGEVSLVQIATRADLEPVIETIARHCDLRQAAVNDSTPFLSDPRKAEFHLRLVDEPGLYHAVILKAGKELVASHIGAIDQQSVVLGLITHSPFCAKESPGKIMLLLLEQMLTEQGFAQFDLTPGGEYKQRFATESDEVYAADIFFDRRLDIAYRIRQQLSRLTRKWIGRRPAAPLWAKIAKDRIRRVASYGARRTIRTAASLAARKMWRDDEYLFYRLVPGGVTPPPELPEAFAVDAIDHLLAFRSESMQDRGHKEFLRSCLLRLEEGHQVVTCMVDGELAHYSWLSPPTTSMGSEMGHRIDLPEVGMVLWDDFTAPRFRGRGLQTMSLRARLHLATAQGMVPYVGVAAQNRSSRNNIERVGFTLWRKGYLWTRFGRTRTWISDELPSGKGPEES